MILSLISTRRSDEEVTLSVNFGTSNTEVINKVNDIVNAAKTEQSKYTGIQILDYVRVDQFEVTEEDEAYYTNELSKMPSDFVYAYFGIRRPASNGVWVDGSNLIVKNRM